MKKFFETPKNAVVSVICIILAIAVLGTCTAFAANDIAKSSSIGSDNAKNFAFADASIDPVSVNNSKCTFGFKKNTFVYVVEFNANNTFYEYIIKASDGSVLEKEVHLPENIVPVVPSTTVPPTTVVTSAAETTVQPPIEESTTTVAVQTTVQDIPETTVTQNRAVIGLAEAKKAALAAAGLTEGQVTFEKAKLDREHGTAVYEIEFFTGTHEYEYEISAATGEIFKSDIDKRAVVKHSEHHGSSGVNIGVDQAKNIALSHAGVSASEVSFSKAKLERDDHVTVYEIEFYFDGMEYEYKIDASSGNIIEHDCDTDD